MHFLLPSNVITAGASALLCGNIVLGGVLLFIGIFWLAAGVMTIR